MYEIQTLTWEGWVNCWTEGVEEKPVRFPTLEAAQEELKQFFIDQHQAVLDGDMDEDYDPDDYQIVEVDGRKGKGKYWYFITEEECVLCFKNTVYRERRYTERPEKYEDRHEFKQYACGQHFM